MTTRHPGPVKINVRLRADADAHSTIEGVLKTKGVIGAAQVFPDETDPELAGMYLLDVRPDEAGSTIDTLQQDKRIEYVEPAAARKLIR